MTKRHLHNLRYHINMTIKSLEAYAIPEALAHADMLTTIGSGFSVMSKDYWKAKQLQHDIYYYDVKPQPIMNMVKLVRNLSLERR